MKRIIQIGLYLILVVSLVGCQKQTNDVYVDYGDLYIYSKEEIDEAVDIIKKEFYTWKGCQLYNITYVEAGDEEIVAWMNELERVNDNQEVFTEAIVFESDFHSPKNGGDGFNSNEDYYGWRWYLARGQQGKWKLMTWGY